MAIKLDFAGSQLNKGLSNMSVKLGAAVLMLLNTHAEKIEYKMKANRPWTDRTGMAKATLSTSVSRPSNNLFRITLAHGVDYGIWLELAHGKNWAIIAPTLNEEGPRVIESLNGLMSKLTL